MKIKELRKAVQEISKEMNMEAHMVKPDGTITTSPDKKTDKPGHLVTPTGDIKKEAPEAEIPTAEVEPTAEENSAAAFVSMILESATQAHIYHLQSDSYAHHMALCAYYGDMPDIVDTLAEIIQGRYGIIKGYSAPNPYAEDNNPVAYFESLLKAVDAARGTLPADSNIQNSVDNVVDLIQSTLYKLTFLK
jgi:hypothetical protein